MNLFAILNKGAALAPPPRLLSKTQRQIVATRNQWKNALLVDQTRAFLDLGDKQVEVLSGLGLMLCAASFVVQHRDGHNDGADAQAIRDGLARCDTVYRDAAAVLTADDAQALAQATAAARHAIAASSDDAVLFAAVQLRNEVARARA